MNRVSIEVFCNVHVNVHVHVCNNLHVRACLIFFKCMIESGLCVCVCVCDGTNAHIRTRTCMHTHMHAHTHACTHTHTHTPAYISSSYSGTAPSPPLPNLQLALHPYKMANKDFPSCYKCRNIWSPNFVTQQGLAVVAMAAPQPTIQPHTYCQCAAARRQCGGGGR